MRGTITAGCARPTFGGSRARQCHSGRFGEISQESLFLADPRSHKVRLLAAGVSEDNLVDPSGRFSPNGRSVAIGSDVAADPALRGLAIYSTTPGVDPRPLGVRGFYPAWSPDGRTLVYWNDDPDNGANIFVVPVAGGPPRWIRQGSHATWSSRDVIAFFDLTPDSVCSRYGACTMRSDGSGVQPPGVDGVQADWSPQGYRLIVVQDDGYSGRLRVAIGCTNGLGFRLVTKGIQPVTASKILADPKWSPDGHKIAFDYDGDIYEIPVHPSRPLGPKNWHKVLSNATLSDWQPLPPGPKPPSAHVCAGRHAPPPTP